MGVAAGPRTIIWGRGGFKQHNVSGHRSATTVLGWLGRLLKSAPLPSTLSVTGVSYLVKLGVRSRNRIPNAKWNHLLGPSLGHSLVMRPDPGPLRPPTIHSGSLSRESQGVPRGPATQMPDGQSRRIDTWSRPETPSVFWHVQGRPSAWCQLTPNLRRVRYLTHGQATATLSQHFA
jgi:hypothetical protein